MKYTTPWYTPVSKACRSNSLTLTCFGTWYHIIPLSISFWFSVWSCCGYISLITFHYTVFKEKSSPGLCVVWYYSLFLLCINTNYLMLTMGNAQCGLKIICGRWCNMNKWDGAVALSIVFKLPLFCCLKWIKKFKYCAQYTKLQQKSLVFTFFNFLHI